VPQAVAERLDAVPALPAAPEARAQPKPIDAASSLALRARALADRGKPLDAVRLALRELAERVTAKAWSDEMLVADSVVAAAVMEDVVGATYSWKRALDTLEAAQPFPDETPPELAAELDLVLARAYSRMGRVTDALRLMRSIGSVTDWRVIGSFANERGGGFDTAYPPETRIDLTAAMRGKERDVAWRSNPCPGQPIGAVLLHEMLRPNDQAVAYLATAVRVERPRNVCLWLGTSGSFKVWHNGRLALARKLERPFRSNQDRVVLALEPGWNPILVKVGVEENRGWLAAARITGLDGLALKDLTVDSSHAGDAVSAGRETAEAPAKRAQEMLEARTGDPLATRLLALWHLTTHPDDAADRTAKKLAEAALATNPDDVDVLYLVARAHEPEANENAAEMRPNERLAPLKRIVKLEPEHVGALLDLAEFWSELNPLPPLADEMSARALAAAPRYSGALQTRIDFLESNDRGPQAFVLRRTWLGTEEGQLLPYSIVALAEEQRRAGDPDGARRRLESVAGTGSDDRAVVDARIDARLEANSIDAVAVDAQTWLARNPFDVSFRLDVASRLEVRGRLADARKLVQQALEVCPEDAQAHFVLSRLAQRENDLAEADRELAEVLRLDPGYDKARRQRALLASQTQSRFDEPYHWDAVERVGTVKSTPGANDSVLVVDRTTVWRVEPDGTEHEYEHLALQIENSAGVKALDNYWITYPGDASLQVYNVRVIHPDGTFERAPAPRGGDQGWSGGGARGFDLPPLRVGDLVDVEYRVDQSVPDVFGQYFGVRHAFQVDFPDALAPVHHAELIVLAPEDVPLHTAVQNGEGIERSVAKKDGVVEYRWTARDLRRPASQSAMPDRSELVPLVDVSTFESWQAFAGWWWNFIEKEFVTTPAMKAKVAELTRGLATEQERVRAIARFVGQEIRYNAWSFGTHGYEPYSAATIFERRFGDCKDKSILLRQMLAEIGVEAHPVLINAEYRRPEEKLDVAMIGHFNHCIAYLPATSARGGYYLDATADRNPIEYLRADDQGAKVLHVRDGKGTIHEVPYASPDDNANVRRWEVALERDGGGEVRLVDTSNGVWGVSNRQRFGGEQGDLKKRAGEALTEELGKVDVLEARTSALEDLGEAAKIELRVRASNLWTRDASGANLRLQFDSIPLLETASEPAEEREFALVLDRPFRMQGTVLYRIPEGSKIAQLPPEATVTAPGLLDYRMVARRTSDGVEIERTFTLHERRIPRERYADFRNALSEIRLAESRTVVLEDTAAVETNRKGDK
jgi:transglutaminase-like putative cysteine protease/tetratricopeptide (TPR) repeat protein